MHALLPMACRSSFVTGKFRMHSPRLWLAPHSFQANGNDTSIQCLKISWSKKEKEVGFTSHCPESYFLILLTPQQPCSPKQILKMLSKIHLQAWRMVSFIKSISFVCSFLLVSFFWSRPEKGLKLMNESWAIHQAADCVLNNPAELMAITDTPLLKHTQVSAKYCDNQKNKPLQWMLLDDSLLSLHAPSPLLYQPGNFRSKHCKSYKEGILYANFWRYGWSWQVSKCCPGLKNHGLIKMS